MRSYFLLVLLLLVAVVLSLAVGRVFIPPGALLKLVLGRGGSLSTAANPDVFAAIFYQLRLPRTVLMALTGAALAGSGAAYQGLFRNPLADPYLIGVASGAGLGAVLALSLRWPQELIGLYAIPVAAFIFSLLTVLLVYLFARVGANVPATNLILAGVAVSSFTGA